MTDTSKARLRFYASNAYIWAHLLLGAAALCWTAATWQLRDRRQFFSYLLTAIIAAGLKVRLPGVQGTASVAFLFVFIGILISVRRTPSSSSWRP